MKKSLSHLYLAATIAAFSLSACVNFPYKAATQQGNVLDADRVAAIHEGMSKKDVINTLGSPILQDVFHADRWDYIYLLDVHYQAPKRASLTLWFQDDKLVKIERNIPLETPETPVKK